MECDRACPLKFNRKSLAEVKERLRQRCRHYTLGGPIISDISVYAQCGFNFMSKWLAMWIGESDIEPSILPPHCLATLSFCKLIGDWSDSSRRVVTAAVK